MKYLLEVLVLSLMLLQLTLQAGLNIAIIGGGIGGTSCAYFLRETFQHLVNIDIYEGNEVGGRIATATLNDGNEYETGGAIVHQRNKYMSDFMDKLGLEKSFSTLKSERLGLYNGHDFDFIESNYNWLTALKVFWRYGDSIQQFNNFLNNMLNKFDRIYELQAHDESFDSVYDLLSAMDPSFISYLQISVRDAFLKNKNFSESLITEVVQASLRVNYGQNINVHEFVGSVSMAGIMDGMLWAVKGGNKRVPEKLLEISKAQLIPEYVTQITKNHEEYTVMTNTKKKSTYDYVVFAAPLSENQKIPITFSNMTTQMKKVGKYHQTITTLVVGNMRKTIFPDLYDGVSPIIVINNNESKFFNSIGNIQDVNGTVNLNIWKVFSPNPLTKNQIDELFESTSEVKVIDWLAYPHYKVPTKSQSFHIADRLYHINAIEWAASAMEMSCIGAKNVALLIKKHYYNEERSGSKYRLHIEL